MFFRVAVEHCLFMTEVAQPLNKPFEQHLQLMDVCSFAIQKIHDAKAILIVDLLFEHFVLLI